MPHSIQEVCLIREYKSYKMSVLSFLTLGPCSLESSTRWVTAHTKMKTQWKARETRKR